ncbi:MAG: putative metallopeptidase [Planctomycetota bacterium]
MARRAKRQGQQEEKRTKIKVRPIPRKSGGKVTEPWAILEALLKDDPSFNQIRNCRVRLWWQKDWKVDPDGITTGAMVCKASEIDRNLVEETGGETPDVFIKLPEKQWPMLDEREKEHRIFHELCHVHPAKDANGEQKRDEKNRWLWRLGRHPVTAFHEELAKYGAEMVIGHNQAVLDAMRRADAPLYAETEKTAAKQ